ncbi:ammonium transporter [Alcanivorax quisquiliarum]|uniref:Ammonium transporter n=1 Tax=Alcanivorax quisquiliarum TaxID=2933565 RepID=A0ABT0E8R8_9GAMM|nr:ammonium transporter [Alcanivorax quisquiliarum]
MENHVLELQFGLNTLYLVLCGALVMWMAGGFAMLEAGLVRARNTTEILAKNIGLFSIACLMYLVCGYAIMYGGDLFLSGIGLFDHGAELAASQAAGFDGDTRYATPADFFFQVVFVATACSIISGAVAERMKLWPFLLFVVFMTALIYPVEGGWTWGGKDVLFGLFNLGDLGFSDFAGAGIVHLAGASAALAGVLLLGPRQGKYGPDGKINAIPGANLPLATLGTLILWMGWFGFNGGSVLKVADMASAHSVAMVFLNTNTAAAGGAVAAMITARLLFGKADLTMILNGALAGLVTITAEAATPSALQATLFGMAGGVLVVFSILLLDRLKIDDPVGAISVHGTCGVLGLMLVPLTNVDATWVGQIVGALTIFAWVFGISLIVWGGLKFCFGLRVDPEEERAGVDVAECGMEAYPEFVNK